MSAPIQNIEERLHLAAALLAAILDSLPSDHDWLDRSIESAARSVVTLHGREEEE